MVSFDVESLYPSVPVEETVELFERWFEECDIRTEDIEVYMKFAKFAMRNSHFKFRGKYYKQTRGTAMGVALAPFLSSDIFMGNLGKKIHNEEWFPRVWRRYIDDIFAVIKKNDLKLVHEKLNSLFPSINFTYGEEINKELPFLDVLVKRVENKLAFEIYRKPTHTDWFIPSNSYHFIEHKMSAFHSMIHNTLFHPDDES